MTDIITLGVGVAYESTKVNLTRLNKMLDSVRAGAPEGLKDLLSSPSYYEATVLFGASVVYDSQVGEVASREGKSFQNMSFLKNMHIMLMAASLWQRLCRAIVLNRLLQLA